MSTEQESVKRAIQMAGSQDKLAAMMGVDQKAISNWLRREKRFPPRRAVQVARLFPDQITKHEMRPDIFDEDGNVYCDLFD